MRAGATKGASNKQHAERWADGDGWISSCSSALSEIEGFCSAVSTRPRYCGRRMLGEKRRIPPTLPHRTKYNDVGSCIRR